MKITKLSDNCDPNKILKEKIKKKNMVCPCCGENREYDSSYEIDYTSIEKKKKYIGIYCYSYCDARYGVQKPYWKHLFDKRMWWRTMYFKCNTCGAEWKSEEFPEIEYEMKGWL